MEKNIIHKVEKQFENFKVHFVFFSKDENQFRQMVVWLEDMKIRFYPIDGRQALRDIQNPQWDQAFSKVNSPFNKISFR